MKARIPVSYSNLPEREKQKIKELMRDIVADQIQKQVDEDEALLQRVWIKMSCIALHEVYGFGEERLLRYIVRWKRMYHKIGSCQTNKEVSAYVDGEIRKIFRGQKYPEEWIEKL